MSTACRENSKGALVLILALAAAAGFGQILLGRDSSTPPEQVSLYVTVEQKDKLVSGLPASDFRLYQDGQSRTFHLEKPETPAKIVLLMEYSASSWQYYNDLVNAVKGFLGAAPKGNWYALATFSNGTKVQVDFTKQVGRIREAFADLGEPTWDEIDTYDAVYKILDILGQLSGRRILILVGSGFDTFSRHNISDVEKKLEATNVVVYCMGAGSLFRGEYQPYLSSMQQMDLDQAQAFMQSLANRSGGEAWFPDFGNAFEDDMLGAFQDIKFQYRLVYSPDIPDDNKLHPIKVDAFQIVNDSRKDYKVLARNGWRF